MKFSFCIKISPGSKGIWNLEKILKTIPTAIMIIPMVINVFPIMKIYCFDYSKISYNQDMRFKPLVIVFVLILLIFGGVIIFLQQKKPIIPVEKGKEIKIEIASKNMRLASSAFGHNQPIPPKYTCDGNNVNPPLSISDVPDDTKSLVLIMDDPDAPAGTWVHWVLWNIDPEIRGIAENNLPANALNASLPRQAKSFMVANLGTTSFGTPGYGGPCPPSGTHRYFFKLYALDIILTLSPQATKEELKKAMNGHVLDKTEFIGLYSRK